MILLEKTAHKPEEIVSKEIVLRLSQDARYWRSRDVGYRRNSGPRRSHRLPSARDPLNRVTPLAEPTGPLIEVAAASRNVTMTSLPPEPEETPRAVYPQRCRA
jgi:hypothetical protein